MTFLQLNHLPLALQAVATSRDLAAGQMLFVQNEAAEAMFVVESGCIWLVNYTEDGQQIKHYSVRPGESFAEVVLFSPSYVCTAIAAVPSRVLVLPKDALLAALRQHPELAETLMAHLAKRLHENKILLELRSMRSARQRLLHYLRLSVEADGVTVNLDRPLKEIADDLGLTPEALSRAFMLLQKEGVISRKRRKVTFRKDLPKLDSSQGR